MARIRTFKPDIWESEKVGRMTDLARLNFFGLIGLADDEGRGRGDSKWLRGRLHSYSLTCTPRLMESSLKEIEAAGLAIFYESNGCKYYWIPGFAEHQRINRPTPSKIPIPPLLTESSLSSHAQLTNDSPPEGIKDQGRDQGTLSRARSENGRERRPESMEAVLAYWKAESLQGDPKMFFDRHEAGGWRQSGKPLEDWRAAARYWSSNEKNMVHREEKPKRPANVIHRDGEYANVVSEEIKQEG